MTQYVWTGRVTDTSVWVRAREVSSPTMELLVADNPAYSGATVYPSPTPVQNIYSWDVTGLEPNRRYYYRVDTNGVPGTNYTGTFRTHPGPVGERLSYVFGAAGDAGLTGTGDNSSITDGVSDKAVFDTMRVQALAEEWAWFSHLGDLHYKNIATNDAAAFRLAYFQVHNYGSIVNPNGRQGHFYRNCPVTYTWDDHDFGANNSNGSSASNPAANTAYRDCVPHYDIPAGTGIYQSWQVGRVLYIASDCRSFRSPNNDPAGPSKTMLGSTQKAWMENLLTADTGAEALVWMSSSRWIGPDSSVGDSWNSFADERDEMVQMLGDTGWLHRMIQLTADKHALSICSAQGNPFGNFPLFMFASMDASYGDPDLKYDIGSLPGRQQYGTVRVNDYGRTLALQGTGWVNGVEWASHTKWINFGNPLWALSGTTDNKGDVLNPLRPVLDDQGSRNDVTARRTDGGEARVTDAEHITAHGHRDDAVTVDVADDAQLPDQAGWRVLLGTVPGMRYPEITPALDVRPQLVDQWLGTELGDKGLITDLPPQHPTGTVEVMAEGYTETIQPHRWDVRINASPGGPWTVGQLPPGDETSAGPDEPNRLDTSGSELLAAVDADDTTFTVYTPQDGPHERTLWMPSGGPGGIGTGEFPFDVKLGGETCRVTAVTPAVFDTFARTVTSGWGSTDTGQSWTADGGVATDYAVSSGNGRHLCSTLSIARLSVLTPLVLDDFDLYCKVAVVATSTGGSQFGGPAARYSSGANLYYVRAEFTTAGGILLSLRKRVADADTQLSGITSSLTYTAGGYVNMRFRGGGTALMAKVWAVGAAEPSGWHVQATDTSHTAGLVGVRSIVTSSNTNVNPTVSYDDFQMANPQTLTVTRALNAVEKAHDAGTGVSLAQPMILAL